MLERAVDQLMKANNRGWGAYVGVATRQGKLGRWSRGGKHELGILPALFVDIDDPDNALLRLGWFDLPASMILHSGHVYHAFWLLQVPTTDFVTADRAIHGLAQHLGYATRHPKPGVDSQAEHDFGLLASLGEAVVATELLEVAAVVLAADPARLVVEVAQPVGVAAGRNLDQVQADEIATAAQLDGMESGILAATSGCAYIPADDPDAP